MKRKEVRLFAVIDGETYELKPWKKCDKRHCCHFDKSVCLQDNIAVNHSPKCLDRRIWDLLDRIQSNSFGMNYIMPKNADHRKQRGRTAPNRRKK